MNDWHGCKNILCVRLDNMGDVLMSSPAFAALKSTFGCKITVLTSSLGAEMAKNIPVVDDVLTWDAPWVKNDCFDTESVQYIISLLNSWHFDAAVIFTVFSQSPLPSALLLSMAGIPKRLAYCRENPYNLLTSWLPDHEPYSFIRHQVERDLALVRSVGASIDNVSLRIDVKPEKEISVLRKLEHLGIDTGRRWVVLHPGVSESKREYPVEDWILISRILVSQHDCAVVISGAGKEASLAQRICDSSGERVVSCAGLFSLQEFIALIASAPAVISVNTSTIHIAAATDTKMIVLYAETNPQHLPWKAHGKVFTYSVPAALRSRNAVLEFVRQRCFSTHVPPPSPEAVCRAVDEILKSEAPPAIPVLMPGIISLRETGMSGI